MQFPFAVFRVKEESMLPAVKPGDYVLVNGWCYKFRVPKPGEIIILKHPNSDLVIIKRIKSVLNDKKLYVTGDNSSASEDSRKFGPIDSKDVIGKVILII